MNSSGIDSMAATTRCAIEGCWLVHVKVDLYTTRSTGPPERMFGALQTGRDELVTVHNNQ